MESRESDEDMAKAILAYFAEHPQATDTAEGVAQWWITSHQDRTSASRVVRVLDGLVAKGLIERQGNGDQRRYRLKRRRPPQTGTPS